MASAARSNDGYAPLNPLYLCILTAHAQKNTEGCRTPSRPKTTLLQNLTAWFHINTIELFGAAKSRSQVTIMSAPKKQEEEVGRCAESLPAAPLIKTGHYSYKPPPIRTCTRPPVLDYGPTPSLPCLGRHPELFGEDIHHGPL